MDNINTSRDPKNIRNENVTLYIIIGAIVIAFVIGVLYYLASMEVNVTQATQQATLQEGRNMTAPANNQPYMVGTSERGAATSGPNGTNTNTAVGTGQMGTESSVGAGASGTTSTSGAAGTVPSGQMSPDQTGTTNQAGANTGY